MFEFLQDLTPGQAGVLGASSGALITFIANQITEYRKGSREDRKVRKETMFFLIQLYKLFRLYIDSYDEQKAFEKFLEKKFKSKMPTPPFDLDHAILKQIDSLRDNYEKVVQLYATVDPVIVTDLMMQADFVEYLKNVKPDEARDEVGPSGEKVHFRTIGFEIHDRNNVVDIMRRTSKIFRKIIMSIGGDVGILTYTKTESALDKLDSYFETDISDAAMEKKFLDLMKGVRIHTVSRNTPPEQKGENNDMKAV